eukprot:TRINITY_DN2367_c0_g1_i1.p3 TRINITY_DN2367_c0_g1~~TRINITY_DN2367_c0_g1_i1.p3  ORF type:complete len:130 (+),score=36.19 TRINITY_DN2367_c0_g1_i1:32-391(+)
MMAAEPLQQTSRSVSLPFVVAALASFTLTLAGGRYLTGAGAEMSLFQALPALGSSTRLGMELGATHPRKKGAKKAADRRPKKSRPSDINRRPPVYPTWEEPAAEYTLIGAGADRKSGSA